MICTRSARQRSIALSSSPLSSATRASSAAAKSSSPRIAASVTAAICGLDPGIIGEFVDAFDRDHRRIHVGDEQLLARGPRRAGRRRRSPANAPSSARARRRRDRAPNAMSAASPSSIQPRRARRAAGRGQPVARRGNIASRQACRLLSSVADEHGSPPPEGRAHRRADRERQVRARARAGRAARRRRSSTPTRARSIADLRILTARPSPEEEARAPHRLFGHVDGADAGYSAARWAAEARAAIAEAHRGGQLADPGRRHRPVSAHAARRHRAGARDRPGDPRRGARDAGRRRARRARRSRSRTPPRGSAPPTPPASPARSKWSARPAGRSPTGRRERVGGIGERIDLVALILLPPRDWLRARCDRAVRRDVRRRRDRRSRRAARARATCPLDAPVRRAIGVPEIAALACGHDHARRRDRPRAALATRQYAKRQYTWFRNQPPADWTAHRRDRNDHQT